MAAVTVPRERHILLVAARPHPVPLTTLALPLLLQEPLWAVTSLSGQRLALTICPHGQLGRIVIVQVSVILVACHVTLLIQIKTENPPLLFCLLISHFLSSVSIKPMTTMLVFLRCVWCVGGGVGGCLCVRARVCVWHAYLLCKRPGLS